MDLPVAEAAPDRGPVARPGRAPAAPAAPRLGPLALGALLVALGRRPGERAPVLRAPRPVDPWTDPWYIVAAPDGVGERTARLVVAVRDAARATATRPRVSELPGFGPRTMHRLAPDLAPSAPPPPPPDETR